MDSPRAGEGAAPLPFEPACLDRELVAGCEQVQDPYTDDILGWAPASSRQRYYDVPQPEDAQAAILRLYANDPI